MKQITDEQKKAIKEGLILIIGALLGWLLSCNTTLNIQKNSCGSNIKTEQSSTATNKQDSTNLIIKTK